jgi:hypothetical protein
MSKGRAKTDSGVPRTAPGSLLKSTGGPFLASTEARMLFVAGHDAPRIGERAATRGRIAMKGGDERAGVMRRAIRPTPA